MANRYRKSLLDKLSSPDQLDKMVVITPPSFWIALLGGFVIAFVALLWSVKGALPEKVEANGIYIPDQDSFTIASEMNGIIKDVSVSVGDEIKAGDTLYIIDTKDVADEKGKLEKRLASVEAITLYTKDDSRNANADTQNLLNIKAQMNASDSNPQYAAYLVALGKYREACDAKDKASAKAKAAQNNYYTAATNVNAATSTSIDLKINEMKDNINRLQALISYYDAEAISEEKMNAAKAAYDAALAASSLSAFSAYPDVPGGDAYPEEDLFPYVPGDEQLAVMASGFQPGLSEEGNPTADGAVYLDAGMSPALGADESQLSDCASPEAPAGTESTSMLMTLSAAPDALTPQPDLQQLEYEYLLAKAEYEGKSALVLSAQANCAALNIEGMDTSTRAAAEAALIFLQSEYNAYLEAAAADPAYSGNSNLAYLKSEFDSASQELANATSLELQYKSNLSSYEASSKSQDAAARTQVLAYAEQFEAAKGALIDQLTTEIEKYDKQLKNAEVCATMDGIVTNLYISKGEAVQLGSQTLILRQVEDANYVICYVPISSGKKIEPGMTVNIYPSTVDRQEYGHINATVYSVSEYIATDSEMFDNVGDEALVSIFRQNGPVVQVVCVMKEDSSTVSGYEWSSNKGADVSLTAGTVVTADIITAEKRPITLLIPFIKETLENLAGKEN